MFYTPKYFIIFLKMSYVKNGRPIFSPEDRYFSAMAKNSVEKDSNIRSVTTVQIDVRSIKQRGTPT